ncbi:MULTISPECIES: translocation/assembly module TamB domain-containing protein [unclassified Meridianimarinicoccus]|uniref:translocation/assembly module TamB domain-containing protein n=1 Tax=unclassified Meridianimarinicoccus TaxID=2923344 RepID=UPI001869405D|nr:translocation/assembly module TamB domain-containing protein [Fluviibacterium sp. MJW13]
MTTRRILPPIILAAVASTAPMALAQDDGTNDDASFLENLIQNALGGEGRTVQVRGLEGLLSSEARIGLIEMSDDDGVFLTVRDIVLDWRRLALVRRRLEVNALTIGTVDFVRPPLPGPEQPPELAADPDAQPEPFALPELPVSVDVKQLSVGGVRIGEPVLGQQVDLSVTGNARLQEGEGALELAIFRIDGQEASIRVAGGFENESRRLYVDLDVSEADDGLITTLAGIPGTPPLELTLKGDAPISDFQAVLELRTDDIVRLAGDIGLREVAGDSPTPDRLITADVGGDVADLFLPEYRDFFGDEITLKLSARQGEAVGLDIEDLDLNTRGLRLTGEVDLSPEYLPVTADLKANLGTEIGLPVVLPLPGPPVLVDNADLEITYDEAAGDTFSLDLVGTGFMQAQGYLLDRVALQAAGQLTKSAPTTVDEVQARVDAEVSGFSTTDHALWQATGDDFTLGALIDWDIDGLLTLRDFLVSAGDITAQGQADVAGLSESRPQISAQLDAAVGDLDRFSALVGEDLSGAIDTGLTAEFNTVTGEGTVTLDGQTRDIVVGTYDSNDLLAGLVDLKVEAARGADGISLDNLSISGERLDLAGTAHIAPDFWPQHVKLTGRVGSGNGVPVDLPVPGQEISLGRADLDVSYDADTGDQYAVTLAVEDFAQAGVMELQDLSLTADGALSRDGSTVTGATSDLVAALKGVSAQDPEISKVLADGADLKAKVDWVADGGLLNLSGFALRSGEVNATAEVKVTDLAGEAMTVDSTFDLVSGPLSRFAALSGQDLTGSVSARGTAAYALDTGFFNVDANARAQNLGIGQPQVDQLVAGETTLIARARRDEDGLVLDTVKLDAAQLNLNADGNMVNDITTINLTAGLKDVGVLTPSFNGPLNIVATATGAGGGWGVDGKMDGPGGSTATVTGDVIRADGTMDLEAVGAIPLGLANVFLLPRTIDGLARFDLKVQGQPGLDAVNGTVTVAGARLTDPATRLTLNDIAVQLGLANSTANLDVGTNLSSGGRITVTGPIGLGDGLPAEITARLSQIHLEDPTLYDLNLNGEIDVNGPLAGGAAISGVINVGRSVLRIPGGLSGAGSIPDIQHVGEGAKSLQTRIRAGLVEEEDDGNGGGGVAYPLDIRISAPNQIFVRGRGIDAEVGGEIQIGGTTASVEPNGSLKLIRGRMSLLAQQLDFEAVDISLQGDLDPDIRMIATSDNGDINAKIQIVGPASDPELSFTSEPELPEDEVLAQLFFGKPVQDLTPLELAQLIGAINTLTGGSGGVFGRIRDGIGVDDLNVSTDEEGRTEVTAGKYLTDKIYTDVTVGSDGNTELELNYEINDKLTARGGFDRKGNTALGFRFELDY